VSNAARATTAAALRARRQTGAASRDRLLDVAEAHFADHGVEGVSIRAINAAAEFGPAASNYHFGIKDDLLRAVVERRSGDVGARQVELLDAAERGPRPSTPQLVGIIATPFFELLERDPVAGLRWLRLATRLAQANNPLVTRRGRPNRFEKRLMTQLVRRYPTHSPEFLEPRWRLAILALMSLISASGDEFPPAMLIRFTARGFDGMCTQASTDSAPSTE
jgi:AcrR family transcriptional regulator